MKGGFQIVERKERDTGFEPATSTLARLHSTTELVPQDISLRHHTLLSFESRLVMGATSLIYPQYILRILGGQVRFWQTGIVWWIVSVMGDYIWRYEMANTCAHGIRARLHCQSNHGAKRRALSGIVSD